MSFLSGYSMTMAEYKADAERVGKDVPMIELLTADNTIVDDIPWIECNSDNGHIADLRTGLPETHWVRFNDGTAPGKGAVSQVKFGTGMMENRMIVDERLYKRYGERGNKWRLASILPYMESINQEFATTLIYGNETVEVDKFSGFRHFLPALDSPHVIDAGGRTADGKLTTLWFISWGPTTCHGIYPKGTQMGVQYTDLGRSTVTTSGEKRMEALESKHEWGAGLAIVDWRAVACVANIPVAKLDIPYGSTGYVDLRVMSIQAKNKLPSAMRSKAIWYANEDVLTAIEIQATDPKALQLFKGEWLQMQEVPHIQGRPIRQVDAILSTEQELPASV